METWRRSPEFDTLAQDAYVVALEELIKHIRRERPEFDVAFLEEALEEQRLELQKLSKEAGVRISPAEEDLRLFSYSLGLSSLQYPLRCPF